MGEHCSLIKIFKGMAFPFTTAPLVLVVRVSAAAAAALLMIAASQATVTTHCTAQCNNYHSARIIRIP